MNAELSPEDEATEGLDPSARPRSHEGEPQGTEALLERITDGFVALDRHGRFTFVNRSAERLLERDRSEILGRRIWQIFPREAEGRVLRQYQKAMAQQTTVHFEEQFPSLGRSLVVRLFPSQAGLSAYFRDITEERRREQALRASEAQFREIAEHVREVLYLATPDAEEVLYVSPTFEEIWGMPREHLLEDAGAWDRIIHPADRARVQAAVPRMREGTYEETYRILRSDGTERWILDRAFPVRDDAGEVYRIVGIAEDITTEMKIHAERERLLTAEREAREAAEREVRRREEVLAVVSHDLKNPLHSIRLNAGVLRELPLPEEQRAEILDRILSVTEQMERLIQGLLDTSRLEAGEGLPIQPERVETPTLLKEACGLYQPQIEQKRIRLRPSGAEDAPPIRADFDRLLQVFWNLIGNAVKFTPEEGLITVRCEPEPEMLLFSVTDSGPGVRPEHLERLFDPFWQEKRTARLGTGLGLPISKAIVEAHGGRIWVESEFGRGTTFRFTVPRA